MIERYHRCNHCLSVYLYFVTGNPPWNPYNDRDYCPNCKKAIVETLNKIPQKYERTYIETNEVTIDQLIEEENRDKGGLSFVRISAPLFDLQDPSNRNIARIVLLNGKEYSYSYWTKTGKDKVIIKVLKEKNLTTGEITDWKEYKQD